MFEWTSDSYQSLEKLARILLDDYAKERLCVAPPINIAHNVTFLVDNDSLKKKEDLKCDDMGAWEHTGSPKKDITVTYTSKGKVDDIIDTSKCLDIVAEHSKNFVIKRAYYVNKTSKDLKKMFCTLHGKYSETFRLLNIYFHVF